LGSLRSDKSFGIYVRSAAREACIATWVLDAYPTFDVGRGKPWKVLIDMAGRQDLTDSRRLTATSPALKEKNSNWSPDVNFHYLKKSVKIYCTYIKDPPSIKI
jgi:hypothetical protein